MIHTFFAFKDGKLITVVQSKCKTQEEALRADRFVKTNPEYAEEQITEWKNTLNDSKEDLKQSE